MDGGFRTLLKDGRYDPAPRAGKYWAEIHRRATELLGPDPQPGIDYALTEVVHCKSSGNQGVTEARMECASRYLEPVLEAARRGENHRPRRETSLGGVLRPLQQSAMLRRSEESRRRRKTPDADKHRRAEQQPAKKAHLLPQQRRARPRPRAAQLIASGTDRVDGNTAIGPPARTTLTRVFQCAVLGGPGSSCPRDRMTVANLGYR